jgi:hypothetical protein
LVVTCAEGKKAAYPTRRPRARRLGNGGGARLTDEGGMWRCGALGQRWQTAASAADGSRRRLATGRRRGAGCACSGAGSGTVLGQQDSARSDRVILARAACSSLETDTRAPHGRFPGFKNKPENCFSCDKNRYKMIKNSGKIRGGSKFDLKQF